MSDDREVVIYDSDWAIDDDMFADWCTDMGYDPEERSDNRLRSEYYEYVDTLLDDEKLNLDIPVEGTIVAYGSNRRWNGVYHGAFPVGQNIADILHAPDSDCESMRFCLRDGDVHGSFPHHDGGIDLVYREVDDDYLEKLEYGEPIGGPEAFAANSKSIAKQICDVYGTPYDMAGIAEDAPRQDRPPVAPSQVMGAQERAVSR